MAFLNVSHTISQNWELSGVPQGLMSGPLLFPFFTNEMEGNLITGFLYL